MKRINLGRVEDPDKLDEFSLFLQTTKITYCKYKDSEKILGNTYGMCILQDFEALTPNLLARTIETVQGGGLIIMLIRSLSSLTSLYTMVMDVHERFRTESHSEAPTGRFNERFLLSLASCGSCMVMDDELNLLPISSHMKSVTPVKVQKDSEGFSEAERDLKDLKEKFKDAMPFGPLIKQCYTLDQGKAVMTFLNAILKERLSSTVALLAGRGRGKSAALGLAIAGAVAAGYSNVFVTAPSPENLKTLFEFVLKGFEMLDYKEHNDYDIVKSSNPELKKATVRIDIHKQHRQTIQYILPHEHGKLSQVELLVIDEAAAIPLPVVKSLIGPYLVFLSSTVNGYEGTGRSLSLKLLKQLEEQSRTAMNADPSGRLFEKIELCEAIRYASGDPVESWLNNLLCLDVANSMPTINRFPPPSECNLYYVNRDTLFSFHKDSELFLQRMMALYVASHYKNSPNDLQLLADAPAHHLFDYVWLIIIELALAVKYYSLGFPELELDLFEMRCSKSVIYVYNGPVDESRNQLPDILCVIQICLEGKISKMSVMKSLQAGHQPSGDQIPWKFCEQFQDEDFPSLSGARIVRIATHPSALNAGYGSAAVELLARYFEGQFSPISEVEVEKDDLEASPHFKVTEAAEKVSLLKENIKARSDLPPLLVHLGERPPEKLHYLGVSFGLTFDLFRFWRKHKFAPFYLCEVPNSVTGEHTCMMLKSLDTDDIQVNRNSDELGFLDPYYRGLHTFLSNKGLLQYGHILDPKLDSTDVEDSSSAGISHGIYDDIVKSPSSMKKLQAYVNRSGHPYLISDLKLPLAYLYFQEKLPVTLSPLQASVLLIMGLQNQDDSYAVEVMKMDRQTILAMFRKAITKFYKYLDSVSTKQFKATLPPVKKMFLRPHTVSVDEDLDEAAKKVKIKTFGKKNPTLKQKEAQVQHLDMEYEKQGYKV
ncbi:RNA cytidine acetyltransferase 1 isoform X1 [Tanacetum coccineum]